MTTKYPSQIDTNTEIPLSTDNVTAVKAEVVNTLRGAILAIESELGADPSREYATVRARLDAMTALLNSLSGGGGSGNANLTTTPPVNITKSSAQLGVIPLAALSDHKHDVSTSIGTNVGANNSEGSSAFLARSDHTHAVVDLNISGQVKGSLLYFNGSNWTQLSPSIDGYVLTTHGSSSAPNWQSASFKLNITGQAKGDLLFFDGTNWVVLNAGANGLVLTAKGAGADPAWDTPGPTLIAAGTQSITSGSLSFVNSNGISFGMSNSNKITASYTVPNTAGLISGINASAGTTSNNLTNFVFSNSNGMSFGLSVSTITGSYTVPTQTNQTEGRYAVGNTTGQSSSSTFDARTMSFSGAGNISVGYSNSALIISGNNPLIISAGTRSVNSGTLIFSNSNGISFGINNSNQITASYTTSNQTNQTQGLYAVGNTTQNSSTTLDARSLSFNGLGNITVGYSNGSIQISGAGGGGGGSVNLSAGTTSNNLTNFVFSNSNGVSFGLNGSTVTASVPSQNYVFSDANNISFGIAGSTITATATFPQTNQSIGLYGLGNTTQNSSTTLDARSLSFNGLGNITVGYSNGSIQISGAGGGGGGSSVNISAGTTSNNLSNFVFSNSNGVSFGLNGSTVTASVPSQNYVFSDANNVSFGIVGSTITATATFPGGGGGGGSLGFYALGNTTQNSSTTLSAASLSFNGLGAMTMGYSNGSIQVSAPATSSLSATGILSISTNGNTISIGVPAFNFSAGTTSSNLNAITFSNSNGISFGLSNGVITATVTPGAAAGIAAIQGGTQTATSGTLSFVNSNGISFGMSNSNQITASYTVPTQTVQTVGLYGLGNTTQNSSTTLDARSLSFNGLGNITVGYSNGSIQISGAGSGGGGGSLGLYALGNTTQNSSTTLSAASLSFNGLGAMSVGYSNGSIQMSAPATSSLSATGILSISTNGNTISIGVPAQSVQTQSNIQRISAGTQIASTGMVAFANSNSISFGMNANTVTAAYLKGIAYNQVQNVNANYTLQLSDQCGFILMSSSSPITITIPTNTSVPFGYNRITIYNYGGGTVTFVTAGGVVLHTKSSYVMSNLYSIIYLDYFSSDEWVISGELAGVLNKFGNIGNGNGSNQLQFGNGNVQFFPFDAQNNISASMCNIFMNNSMSTHPSLTFQFSMSVAIGLYSVNSSTLSVMSSGSKSFTAQNSANNSTAMLSGIKNFSIPIAVNITPGNYYIGIHSRTASAVFDWMTMNNLVISVPFPAFSGLLGSTVNNSDQIAFGLGQFSVSSSTLNASYAISQINGTQTNQIAIPFYEFRNF